jgi:hypothetical protein
LFGSRTDLRTRLDQLQRIGLIVDIALGDSKPLLRAAQREVVARDFGKQRHLRIVQGSFAGTNDRHEPPPPSDARHRIDRLPRTHQSPPDRCRIATR